MLTHLSLFTGIGGIDLAAEWAGFKTVGQVEWADYPIKVLEKHWPDVPRWRDIRDVTAESLNDRGVRTVDLVSGGDPCQPHSLAGKRKGTADGRYLWPEYFKIIQTTNPSWVINENVVGSLSNGVVLNKINDMEGIGYRCQPFVIPAYSVGAWHIRERVFIVANSNSFRQQRGEKPRSFKKMWEDIKEQSERLYKAPTCNTNSEPKPQENKKINPVRSKWEAWKEHTRQLGGTLPRNYWTLSEPPVPGVDDGISKRVDRLKCLGNAVVPQQVYPILKAIADIETCR